MSAPLDPDRVAREAIAIDLNAQDRPFTVVSGGKPERAERADGPDLPTFKASPFRWTDPAALPARAWLYGHNLIRKFVSVTVAPGGVGKSTLLQTEALAMATGKALLGVEVERPLRVWLWNLEDPGDELARRMQAICQHYGVTADDIGDRPFIDTGREQELCTAITGKSGVIIQQPVIDNLVAELLRNRIDVLIVDPFISSHAVSENDNPAMDAVAKAWGRVADKTTCAISLVHHTRKQSADSEVNAESARGAKALIDAARDVRALNRMTADEGVKAGVDNHRLYFRVFSDKANLAPPAEKSDWYRLASVALANGDHVGVVEPWKWPDSMAGVTAADVLTVQKAIDNRQLRENVQAHDWIGYAIGTALSMDPAKGSKDRPKIVACIKSWIESGALVRNNIVDDKGKTRPILEVGEWAT